jgi:hypothetical protein
MGRSKFKGGPCSCPSLDRALTVANSLCIWNPLCMQYLHSSSTVYFIFKVQIHLEWQDCCLTCAGQHASRSVQTRWRALPGGLEVCVLSTQIASWDSTSRRSVPLEKTNWSAPNIAFYLLLTYILAVGTQHTTFAYSCMLSVFNERYCRCKDRLCGLVVRVRFPALPDFLWGSGSETGSSQPREYNWGATGKKK